jgi:zinc/manganese transport system permease protein
MGWMGDRLRGRDIAIGGTRAFSLALCLLFLSLSTRFSGLAVNILFGSILSIALSDVRFVAALATLALMLLGLMDRPVLFASVDAEIADAHASLCGDWASRSWSCWRSRSQRPFRLWASC